MRSKAEQLIWSLPAAFRVAADELWSLLAYRKFREVGHKLGDYGFQGLARHPDFPAVPLITIHQEVAFRHVSPGQDFFLRGGIQNGKFNFHFGYVFAWDTFGNERALNSLKVQDFPPGSFKERGLIVALKLNHSQLDDFGKFPRV